MTEVLSIDQLIEITDKAVRQALGGKVRLMLSGAAPLPRHVEEFLRVSCCSSLTQGYGLTETCGGCFTSVPNVMSMIGTVGVPITTMKQGLNQCWRWDTMHFPMYKTKNPLPFPSMFQDLLDLINYDSYLYSLVEIVAGDIGELQPDGTMKTIDRKKNIFKLSQDEYVAVENIENTYSRCPHIASIWVYGNSFESFLVAVVVPERKALGDWAMQHNEPIDFK
ncbi:hypothetical protein GQ457_18G019830 [Hibiscus cannabinus]